MSTRLGFILSAFLFAAGCDAHAAVCHVAFHRTASKDNAQFTFLNCRGITVIGKKSDADGTIEAADFYFPASGETDPKNIDPDPVAAGDLKDHHP